MPSLEHLPESVWIFEAKSELAEILSLFLYSGHPRLSSTFVAKQRTQCHQLALLSDLRMIDFFVAVFKPRVGLISKVSQSTELK